MVDFDTMLREALAEDAERAPALPDTWTGPTVTARMSSASPRFTRRRLSGAILVGVAAVAATIGVLVVVDYDAGRQVEVEPADTGGWTPPGVEFPLEDLGVPESNMLWVTVAGLSRALGVEGQTPLVIATTLQYASGATAEVHRCLSRNGGAGCLPEWARDGINIGITATGNLWTWSNVPPDAAYVTYVDDPEVRWQRPVAGVAVFPNVAGDDEVAIAYTSNGTELARVDLAAVIAANRRLEAPPRADISQAQYEELLELTDVTLRDCLTGNGARLDVSNVAVLPTGVDDVEVWDQCVDTVKQVVADRVDEMNVTFDASATQLPTASNPASQSDTPAATDEAN